MRRLSIRLLLSYIALAALALAGAGLLAYGTLAPLLKTADQDVINNRVLAAEQYTTAMLLQHSSWEPQTYATDVMRVFPDIEALVVDAAELSASTSYVQGQLVYLPRRTPPSALVVRGLTMQAVTLIDRQGSFQGVLRLRYTHPEDVRAAALRRALVGAAGLAMVAAVLLALWLSRTLVAPLRRVADAAGRLAEGHWDAALPAGGPTEIDALSRAFRTMAQRLQTDFQQLKSDREKLQHLAAEVAHEIKTPIASLRTYHELLLDGEQEHPEHREQLLRRGAAQVERLEYLAHFLVDMARLEAHAAPLDLEQTDLADLVALAVSAVQPAAQQKGVQVVVQRPKHPVPVLANPQRLGQAIDNLLHNALTWTPAETAIRVAVGFQHRVASVTVADEGPGIPEQLLPEIFTPFVRGQESTGLGLGLAIVRAIAVSHGGTVYAANRPEGGATFTLSLPVGSTDVGSGAENG